MRSRLQVNAALYGYKLLVMKRIGSVSLLVGALACASAGDSNPRPRPTEIFRWIAIGTAGHDTIRLGEPLRDAARYAERISDSSYRLRPGTFGGADSIELRLTPDGRVKEMHFTYPSDAAWGEMIRTYARSLGPGTHVQMTEGRDLTRWEDTRTRFVVGTGGRAGSRMKAALIDLQLAR